MLDSDKGLLVAIEFDDAAGFPTGAQPDAPPQWTEDQNGAVVKLQPSDDGLSCQVLPVAPGNANLQMTCSVNGTQFTGTLPVPVQSGAAVSVKLVATPIQ